MWPPPNGINVARWVKYFEDPALKALHAGQAGSFSYPDEDGLRRDRQMTETRETVEKLKQELQEVRAAAGAQGAGAAGASTTDETSATGILRSSSAQSGWAPGRAARAAGCGRHEALHVLHGHRKAHSGTWPA